MIILNRKEMVFLAWAIYHALHEIKKGKREEDKERLEFLEKLYNNLSWSVPK